MLFGVNQPVVRKSRSLQTWHTELVQLTSGKSRSSYHIYFDASVLRAANAFYVRDARRSNARRCGGSILPVDPLRVRFDKCYGLKRYEYENSGHV